MMARNGTLHERAGYRSARPVAPLSRFSFNARPVHTVVPRAYVVPWLCGVAERHLLVLETFFLTTRAVAA